VGRTNLYEVVLQPPPHPTAPPQELLHPTPAEAVAPKRPQLTTPKLPTTAREDIDALIAVYPERPEPHIWPAVLKAVNALVREGVALDRLMRSAERYAVHCKLNGTEPQYVKALHRWLNDGIWKTYDVRTLYGRTREEWIRSGQDVAEFDRLTQPRDEEAVV
jgi:hypothetical protein